MILVVNKVDRPDARIAEVVDEVYELFLDLDADEAQIEFPIVYTNARAGRRPRPTEPSERRTSSRCCDMLLDARAARRRTRRTRPLQALVTNLDASPYLGRLALCRVRNGTLRRGEPDRLVPRRRHGPSASRSPSCTSPSRSTASTPTRPGPGEIIAIAGMAEVTIGETLADPEDPRPLPVITRRRAAASR